MNKETLRATQTWVQEELRRSIRFWLSHGLDPAHGGVYTCLGKAGEVYSTDKSVWMQGRCAWTFAALCRQYGVREEWLAASRSCLDFLEKHCINRACGDRLYFTVTEDGRPLRQRRYCFSEAFYAMANAEYYGVCGDRAALLRARRAYELINQLNQGLIADPTGLGAKTESETRATRALADPMIYLNITAIMRRCDPERRALYDQRAQEMCTQILRHRKPELRATLESVAPDGTPELSYTAGRVVNPGHDMECAWFLMEQANFAKDDALHRQAVEMFDDALRAGWDEEFGGILYFVDCLGKPPEAYEHDMKLWWPHNEGLIASLMIYRDTGDAAYWAIFEKLLAYCKAHFSEPEYGDWWGYLRRDGVPTAPPCKGSTYKGPFHLPRCLMMLDRMLGELLEKA